MQHIKILLICLFISGAAVMARPTGHTGLTPGNCRSYAITANQVVFHCDNKVNILLKQCSPGIIKLWYEQGDFTRNNASFAVVSEEIEKSGLLSVTELPQRYEIYTSELIIRVNKNPFQLRIYDKYQKLLFEDYADHGYVKDSTWQAAYKTLRPDEHFFGLGEKTGNLDRRGKSFHMWNSDKPCYGVNEDPLYKSIPFFMSNYGYGIFFDNTSKTAFKFGSESGNYFSFEAPAGEMEYYFIFGPSYKQIIERYTQLTGKPIMPPEWAFGFSQCRGLYTNEILAREVGSEFRKRQIPCDIIYQDIGWTQNLQDFEWRKPNYTDPVKMLADLANLGFKVIVSQDPVISQNNTKQWHEADSLGYLATDIRTGKSYDMPWPWGGNCGVVDFTKPGVADWWGNYQQKAIADGVRGFWTDMGEPAWSNEESTDRLNMKHFLGMHNEIHNIYGLTWDKAVTEQFEKHNANKRVFQMTRAGYAGLQRYTFGWSGDSGDGNDVLSGWNKLAAQIPLALSAGMGLIPFWTTDISGYCGDIKDRDAMAELYIRWMQFGVFNPLSRAHHEGNNAAEPWTFGTQAESICRDAISLKYKLHPYIYTYARNAYDTGMPLMRALLLEYPDDAETFRVEGEFLLGKEMLVAPVVEKEASSKQVYLPQGEWIDYNDGKTVYRGKQWIDYRVQLSTIPMFVKRGSVIPTMPVMQYIGEKKGYPVIFEIFPAAEGRTAAYTLYEDDGESNDYKKDIFCRTAVRCITSNETLTTTIEKHAEKEFGPSAGRNYGIKLHLEKCPGTVITNKVKAAKTDSKKIEQQWYQVSEKVQWSWDKTTGICSIKLADRGILNEIVIVK